MIIRKELKSFSDFWDELNCGGVAGAIGNDNAKLLYDKMEYYKNKYDCEDLKAFDMNIIFEYFHNIFRAEPKELENIINKIINSIRLFYIYDIKEEN